MSAARLVLVLSLLALSLAGCKQKQGIYYWGDYSDTYYMQMKEPGEAADAAHLRSLEAVIEQSKSQNLAVPPGVHAEYGFIMFKAGKMDAAITNFEQEKTLYPESRVLMDRLIASAGMRKESEKTEAEKAPEGLMNIESQEGAAMAPETDEQAAVN